MVGSGAGPLVGGAGGGFGRALAVDLGGRLVVGADVRGLGSPVGVADGVTFGAVRLARDTGAGLRAPAGLTVPAGFSSAAGFEAGVAYAIAPVSAPVASTEPAATPLLTSDNLRSARSRCWPGGDAIEALSAHASPIAELPP